MGDAATVVIAISRQIACGGTFIAQSTARRLGFKYVDRDILYEAARNLGVDVRDLSGMEEKSSGFFDNLVRSFSFGTPESAYVVPSRRPVYDRDLYEAEAAIIRELAEKHDAVIVGRGGGHALGNHPGLVKIFLHAPKQDRTIRLMNVRKTTDGEKARREVEESDRNREKFMRDMTGIDWTDARNYHLSVDTSVVGFQAAEDMIVQLVHARRSSFASGR